jgi:hypothetical protein
LQSSAGGTGKSAHPELKPIFPHGLSRLSVDRTAADIHIVQVYHIIIPKILCAVLFFFNSDAAPDIQRAGAARPSRRKIILITRGFLRFLITPLE